MRQANLATPGQPIRRIVSPVTLAAIAKAIGVPLLEVAHLPGLGRVFSTYRAWTTDGRCYELKKAGPEAFMPRRVTTLDRVPG
jgi:hypothetical protein